MSVLLIQPWRRSPGLQDRGQTVPIAIPPSSTHTHLLFFQHQAPDCQHGTEGRSRQGRKGGQQVLQGRPAVPGRPHCALPEEGQVRRARRCRRARLPGRRHGVPCRRGAGAGRQRRARQQEEPHHSAPHPTRHPQRRGAVQAVGHGDHRRRRRAAQHPLGATAQEDGQGQGFGRRVTCPPISCAHADRRCQLINQPWVIVAWHMQRKDGRHACRRNNTYGWRLLLTVQVVFVPMPRRCLPVTLTEALPEHFARDSWPDVAAP
eukprot:361423-Chlamydomonas_euryale.AAC.3